MQWRTQMSLGREVDLGRGNIVLDGDPVPTAQRGTSPQFSVHVCCGQTAGWIKMPLGTEVGLGLGDIVLDGDQAPPKREHISPFFSGHVYCGKRSPISATAEYLLHFA